MRRKNLVLGAFAAVIGASGSTAAVALSTDRSQPTPTVMPALDHPPGANCIQEYPNGLADLPIAFDGTIVGRGAAQASERRGDPEANAAEIFVTLRVNAVYAGNVGPTVRMRTWDYDVSTVSDDRVGDRYLVATTESLDAMFCGFTRPYNDQDAAYWAEVFGGAGS